MDVLHGQKPSKSGFAHNPEANNSVSLRKLEGRIWLCCGGWWDGRGLLCQFEPPELHNLPIQIAPWTHLPLNWKVICQVVVEDCWLLSFKIPQNICEKKLKL